MQSLGKARAEEVTSLPCNKVGDSRCGASFGRKAPHHSEVADLVRRLAVNQCQWGFESLPQSQKFMHVCRNGDGSGCNPLCMRVRIASRARPGSHPGTLDPTRAWKPRSRPDGS